MKRIISEIDLSKSKRRYFSNESNSKICPECGSGLMEEKCTILVSATSKRGIGKFMTNLSGSHFCIKCPVVIFNREKIEQAVYGIRGEVNLTYCILGIIDFDSMPENKRYLEMGSDENPIPLVKFLPDLNNRTISVNKKTGRNTPCVCGSGIKYKKCCGND